MTEISKKNRDIAMRAIVDFYQNKKPYDGTYITSDYLYKQGLPAGVDAAQVVKVLKGMHLISLKQNLAGEQLIVLEDAGRCYFEVQADEKARRHKEHVHDWLISLVSILGGALLSQPLWALISAAFHLLAGD